MANQEARETVDRKIEKKKWSPKRIGVISVLGVLLVGTAWTVVSGGRERTLRTEGDRLRISTVERGTFQEFTPVVGTIIPIRTYYLDATEGGRVEQIYREAGSIVEEGDSLLKLANTNLLMDVMYREAELFQQSNNLRNTKITMEQNRLGMKRDLLDIDRDIERQRRTARKYGELSKSDLISREEYEEAEEELQYLLEKRDLLLETQRQDSLFREIQITRLEGSLARIEANLHIVEENLGNLVIRAPISGQLTALDAEVGQSKARGERLGQIDVLDGCKIRAEVDELYITRVGSGLPATFPFDGETYNLAVEKVYPEVARGRFEVDLRFEGTEPSELRRGQTFHVRLELGDSAEALLLPTGGFYRTTGGRWVYVLDDDGKEARRREIRLGRQNTDFYEVLSGLEPGERVITSSYDNLGEVDRLVLK